MCHLTKLQPRGEPGVYMYGEKAIVTDKYTSKAGIVQWPVPLLSAGCRCHVDESKDESNESLNVCADNSSTAVDS